jgi:hypothetical protein
MLNATIISKTLPHHCLLPQHKSIQIKNSIDKISNIDFKRSFEKDSIGILIFMIECSGHWVCCAVLLLSFVKEHILPTFIIISFFYKTVIFNLFVAISAISALWCVLILSLLPTFNFINKLQQVWKNIKKLILAIFLRSSSYIIKTAIFIVGLSIVYVAICTILCFSLIVISIILLILCIPLSYIIISKNILPPIYIIINNKCPSHWKTKWNTVTTIPHLFDNELDP